MTESLRRQIVLQPGLVVTVLFADGKTRTNTRYNGYLTHSFYSQRACP